MKIPLLIAASLVLAACSGASSSAPAASGPSGSLGVFSQADADIVMKGLCAMASLPPTALDTANGTFYDTVHERLHVLAAATETVDRALSATVLQTKEKVEEDLRSDTELPATYPADAAALLDAVAAAIKADGLEAAAC